MKKGVNMSDFPQIYELKLRGKPAVSLCVILGLLHGRQFVILLQCCSLTLQVFVFLIAFICSTLTPFLQLPAKLSGTSFTNILTKEKPLTWISSLIIHTHNGSLCARSRSSCSFRILVSVEVDHSVTLRVFAWVCVSPQARAFHCCSEQRGVRWVSRGCWVRGAAKS